MYGRFSRARMTAFLLRGYEVETSYAVAKGFDPASAPWIALFRAYAKVAYANWHFIWLRRQSRLPSTIRVIGFVERLLRAPLTFFIQNPDKKTFSQDDFLLKASSIDETAVGELSTFLHAQKNFYDIYQRNYVQTGLHALGAPATIYVRTVDFVRNDAFWRIVTSPALYEACRNIMGRNARITWAWLWYSAARNNVYQNQNWHRDTGEPFNFLRVFVPLTNVQSADDGPTIVVKGSTQKEVLYERRRFSEKEVTGVLGTENTTMALAEVGDMYLANTFCLHRGLPPKRPREMLSLLVSYQNSYRTKGLPLVPFSSLSAEQQAVVGERRKFYSEICDFRRRPRRNATLH